MPRRDLGGHALVEQGFAQFGGNAGSTVRNGHMQCRAVGEQRDLDRGRAPWPHPGGVQGVVHEVADDRVDRDRVGH